MPAEFIAAAEESRLIMPIGRQWVLDAAWGDSAPARRLAVNVSALQFHQPDFAEVVAATLARHGIGGGRLCLELTESALLRDVDAAAERMARLKAIGVRISLDDFGTGYSSLSCLQRLPIDEVKIDRSFVRDLASKPQDAAIVRAIVTMCRDLGLSVVAEGVETARQHDFLLACGCDAFQGYLFGRPAPLAAARPAATPTAVDPPRPCLSACP